MPISLHPKHRYVTQTSAYDRLLVGRVLTDRIIKKRQKEGFFGGLKHKLPLRKKQKQKRVTLDSLINEYA